MEHKRILPPCIRRDGAIVFPAAITVYMLNNMHANPNIHGKKCKNLQKYIGIIDF